MVSKIVRELESLGESEVTSETIGETVMAHLRDLDDVAYVRFASVYQNFREAKDFEAALAELSGDEAGGVSAQAGATAVSQDQRFMALALALGRAGSAVPGPIPPSARSSSRTASIIGRGWTQPGGRPHAETEALRRAGDGGARRDAIRHARAVFASRQIAALRRRGDRGGHFARVASAIGGSQSRSGGAGATPDCGPRASPSTSASARMKHGTTMPATSFASPKAVLTSCSSSRSQPTAKRVRRDGSRSPSPARPFATACICYARRATPSWSASARRSPTIRC